MLKRKLAEAQESVALKEEKYTSLQQEAEVKTKKLKKLVSKLSEAKAEIRDVQSEWQREKEDIRCSLQLYHFLTDAYICWIPFVI